MFLICSCIIWRKTPCEELMTRLHAFVAAIRNETFGVTYIDLFAIFVFYYVVAISCRRALPGGNLRNLRKLAIDPITVIRNRPPPDQLHGGSDEVTAIHGHCRPNDRTSDAGLRAANF
jgi:hypothetical protein